MSEPIRSAEITIPANEWKFPEMQAGAFLPDVRLSADVSGNLVLRSTQGDRLMFDISNEQARQLLRNSGLEEGVEDYDITEVFSDHLELSLKNMPPPAAFESAAEATRQYLSGFKFTETSPGEYLKLRKTEDKFGKVGKSKGGKMG